MRAMAAEEFGPPSALREIELPVPTPGAEEVSIDVAYAGVGFVDTLLRAGVFPLPTPLVPGIEVTGTVREVGAGVEGMEPGETVAALLNDFGRGPRAGGYATVAVAHRSMAVKLPEDADLPTLTGALSNGTAAWIALHEVARLRASDRVLVLGSSGGIGAIAARLAALHPAAQVIGVVSGDRSRAPEECSDVLVADRLDEDLASMTADGAVDVVIDPVGGRQRAEAFGRLAAFGRHVVVGNASGEDRPFAGDAVWLETRAVAGLSVGGIAHRYPGLVQGGLLAITALLTRGVLRQPRPKVEPLAAAAEVHQAIEERRAPAKTILDTST
jgi:NADPH:quinone reductase